MGGEKPERDVDEGQAPTVARAVATPVASEDPLPAARESQPVLDLQGGGATARNRIPRIGAGAMGVVWCALRWELALR